MANPNPNPNKLNPDSEPLLVPPPNPYYSVPYYAAPARPPPPPAIPYFESHAPTFILVPIRFCRSHIRRRRPCRSFLSSSTLVSISALLLFLCAAVFFLWPSDPDLSISRLRLDRIKISTSSSVSLTISIGLELKVRNLDFFSLDYSYLNSSISYRGRWLGSVTSGGGRVRARGVSYVEADLHLDGIQVINDVIYLIEDIANGYIPFDTVTEIVGELHLFFLDVPVKGKISCSVGVNPANQSIVRQDCYPQ